MIFVTNGAEVEGDLRRPRARAAVAVRGPSALPSRGMAAASLLPLAVRAYTVRRGQPEQFDCCALASRAPNPPGNLLGDVACACKAGPREEQ